MGISAMKLFSGFPGGKLQVTPLPNLFFSELLPAIDDLAELKLTLHLFWFFAVKKRRSPSVTVAELRGDPTLMQSLSVEGEEPGQALTRAVARAIERGTLVPLTRQAEGQAQHWLFLNSESGRRALEEAKAGKWDALTGEPAPEPATASARPNIFVLYESNIGLITPLLADELKDAEAHYPEDWIEDAFRAAVENNKRSWSYIRAILERWQTEGRGDEGKKGKPWYGDEYAKYVQR